MKILDLELKGFTRLSLNQVESFKITLDSPTQLILGTNGSGKSSVLQELSPMPASHYDYKKTGYKIIRIQLGSQIFRLKSEFITTQKHSFYNETEEVELNPGGTVSVQKELVKEYFGVNAETMELLQSAKGFSSMSIAQRRQWFTKLNDTNYDYAIAVYNKLKEKARDTNGALKNAKKRLVSETAMLMDKQSAAELQRQHDELLSSIEELHNQRAKVYDSNHGQKLLEHREQLHRLLLPLNTQIQKSLGAIDPLLKKLTPSQCNEELGSIAAQIAQCENTAKEASDLYACLEREVLAITQASNLNAQELLETKNTLLKKIKEIKESFKIVKDPQLYDQQSIRIAQSISTSLDNVFMQLPSNSDKRFSRSKMQELTQECEALKESLTNSQHTLNRIEAYIATQEQKRDHDKRTCPNCNHYWSEGFNPTDYERAKEALQKELSNRDKIGESLRLASEELQALKSYSTTYRDYMQLANSYGCFEEYWKYIEAQNITINAPTQAITVYSLYCLEIDKAVQCNQYLLTIEEIDKQIELSKNIEKSEAQTILQKASAAQSTIEQQNALLVQLKNKRAAIQRHLSVLQSIHSCSEKIAEVLDNMDKNNLSAAEFYRSEAYSKIIRQAQIELAVKQKALTDLNIKKALIDDLEKEIDRLNTQEKSFKLMLKELSPTEGLIAEGMWGFIKIFVAQMNQVISKIWNYPLKIQACDLSSQEEVDLDYQFPFTVQGQTRADVSKGSSAMMEIFDFAFKVVASRYLSKEPWPLYLDELGKTMDVEHKMRVIDYVKTLSDKHIFSQIFLISHDILQYGALSNTQICVLCDANISIPKDCVFNQHVTIE